MMKRPDLRLLAEVLLYYLVLVLTGWAIQAGGVFDNVPPLAYSPWLTVLVLFPVGLSIWMTALGALLTYVIEPFAAWLTRERFR